MEEQVHYVHVDSKNRDSNLYPSGNNYTLHLVNPIKNVTRVDLITAKVPNSMYNLTNGTNVFVTSSGTLSFQPGFYSAPSIVSAFTDRGESLEYLPSQGKFVYLSNDPTSTCTVTSDEFAKMLGLTVNKVYAVSVLDIPINSCIYGVTSERVIDLSLNEFVFLDIEEFRTPFFDDAKSMPLSGINAGNMFAAIPMDVPSTQVKTFKENTDYIISLSIAPQILSRLTIHWYDKNLKPLNFQGFENNGFILRVYTTKTLEKPVDHRPVDIDAQIEFIKRKLQEEEEKEKNPETKIKFGKWTVLMAFISILVFWYVSKKIV